MKSYSWPAHIYFLNSVALFLAQFITYSVSVMRCRLALFIFNTSFLWPFGFGTHFDLGASLKCQCKGLHFDALIGFEHVVTKNSSIPRAPWIFRHPRNSPNRHLSLAHTHENCSCWQFPSSQGRIHQDARMPGCQDTPSVAATVSQY